MGILRNVLERLGFARLGDYGLILTPDRRVLTTRTRILDDGFGGRVVGWTDGDLATMELGTFGEAPEPRPIPPPLLAPPPRPAPVVAAPAPIPAPAPAPAPVAAAAPSTPEEPEDEWEWEIAMARARANATEEAKPEPAAAAPRRGPFTTSQWLTKEPLTGGWQEDTAIRPMERVARASEQMLAVDARPRTIIPVPVMPVADPQLVRSHHEALRRQAPRRFARPSEQPIAAANDYTSPASSLPARARR